MATIQSFCPVCRKTVTAHTMWNDDYVLKDLQSKMGVKVMHVVRMAEGNSADHMWSLEDEEKNNLLKYLTGH